jgi:hypothetical protein
MRVLSDRLHHSEDFDYSDKAQSGSPHHLLRIKPIYDYVHLHAQVQNLYRQQSAIYYRTRPREQNRKPYSRFDAKYAPSQRHGVRNPYSGGDSYK